MVLIKLLTLEILYRLIFALGIGIIFFTLYLKLRRGNTQMRHLLDDFITHEQEAHFITKKTLPSNILLDLDLSSLPKVLDTECLACYDQLLLLSHKPMVNLQAYDNLTLKKEFGINHLETLCDYEQHYIHFLKALTTYGIMLHEKGFIAESIFVLEFCIQIGCDLNNCYLYLIRNYGIIKDKNSLEDLKRYLEVQPPLGKEVIRKQLDVALQSIKNQ